MSKGLDKFYTKESVILDLIDMLEMDKYDIFIEPSAGDGAFLKHLPKSKTIAMDIQPDVPEIFEEDFFNFRPSPEQHSSKSIITVGNPPFGKNSSLAIKFFNHAAKYSECIAFVLPRTFRKPSVINRLDASFYLEREKVLESKSNSFYLPTGEDYDVPTVIQVWKKYDNDKTREKINTVSTHEDFEFLSPKKSKVFSDIRPCYSLELLSSNSESYKLKVKQEVTLEGYKSLTEEADFCVRRVGAAAGKIYKDFKENKRDWKSHYYIKEVTPGVASTMESINWDYHNSPKYDIAGNPSISKNELINFYVKTKKDNMSQLEIEE